MDLINLSDKKVFIFNNYCYFDTFLKEGIDSNFCLSRFFGSIILTDVTLAELQIEFDNKIKNTVPKDGAVFLFDSSSKFPRFKLTGTSYKRCIKEGKEDFVIIGDVNLYYTGTLYKKIIQTEDAYYLFPNYAYFHGVNADKYQLEYASINSFIEKYKNKFFSTEIINSYDYNVVQVSNPKMFMDIITDKVTNVLTDSALDKIITGTFEKLDYDKFKQIKALIESSDVDNVGLGLRLLCNYDIEPMLASVNFLIARNYDVIRRRSEWHSTAVKQLRKNLYIDERPFYGINTAEYYTTKPKKSEDDTRCCEEIFQETVLYHMASSIANINNIAQKSNFKTKFKPIFE